MYLIFIFLFCLSHIGAFSLSYENPSFSPHMDMQEPDFIVNNRILAKVHNKTISLIDVMKKMDVFLSENYPEHAKSKIARYQFFSSQWRQTLSQMIDNELIFADAEQKELKISDAEIREELQHRFGPNVMENLENLALSYQEAKEMIESDLIVEKMIWYRVHSKAYQNVNPASIKKAYHDYVKENPPSEEWTYQVLSIKGDDVSLSEELSQVAYKKALELKKDLKSVATLLEENKALITVQEYQATNKTISLSHREVLDKLGKDLPSFPLISLPIIQTNRDHQKPVHKIFCLQNYKKNQPPIFKQLIKDLRNQLIQKSIDTETSHYITKLRERFGYDEKHLEKMIPKEFQPFILKVIEKG